MQHSCRRLHHHQSLTMGPRWWGTCRSIAAGSPTLAVAATKPVHVSDLPKPWMALLITHHLTRAERKALACACKSLATCVMHHTQLHLRPASSLQDNSRRAAVLSLAAACSSIHLHLQGRTIPLDVQPVLQCITQITLCDVGLSDETISSLHLERLSRLHTLRLTSNADSGFEHGDNTAAGQLLNTIIAGGLPQLQNLHVDCADPEDTAETLLELGPALGGRVTHLTMTDAEGLDNFSTAWVKLQRLEVKQGLMPPFKMSEVAWQQLAKHPLLKHVTLPLSDLTPVPKSVRDVSVSWDVLSISGPASDDLLQGLPLKGVKQLQLHNGFHVSNTSSVLQLLSSIADHTQIQWVPRVFATPQAQPPAREIFEMSGDTLPSELVAMCTQNMHDGVVMMSSLSFDSVEVARAAFSCLAPGVHTLNVMQCCVGKSVAWEDVFKQVPPHIKHLMLSPGNAITKEQLFAVLRDRSAPALTHMTIISVQTPLAIRWHVSDPMRWVSGCAAELLWHANTCWPGLKVGVICRPNA